MVTWGDAWGSTGWVRLEQAVKEHIPLSVTSVGFVLTNNKKGIQLTGSFDANGNPGGQQFIPRGMIIKIKKVSYKNG